MKLGFGKIKSNASIPGENAGIVSLVTSTPLEIQAGEKIDFKTGLMVRVPEGYILSIQSSPTLLAVSGIEVLGPTFVASEDESEIKIPLYNTSNGQINLHPGAQVAVALLIELEPVEIEEFSPEKQKAGRGTPVRPKKDPFKFKIS